MEIQKIKIKDMEKLESPFVRAFNDKGEYLVTPQVTPGYDWVFTDDSVMAIEKLDGTNVSIVIESGVVTSVWNRTERIPFINKPKKHIIEGVLNSWERGYCDLLEDGQHFGELIGPKVNKNPYKLEMHLWIPFTTFAQKHLKYKAWGKYPKDFKTISAWFEKDLMPLYWTMKYGSKKDKDGRYEGFVEGIVFTSKDGKMAKLRKDMFPFFTGPRHNDRFDVDIPTHQNRKKEMTSPGSHPKPGAMPAVDSGAEVIDTHSPRDAKNVRNEFSSLKNVEAMTEDIHTDKNELNNRRLAALSGFNPYDDVFKKKEAESGVEKKKVQDKVKA